MRLAITGGTGFLGGHVIDAAVARGHDVIALARRQQPERDGVRWVAGALDDRPALARLAGDADAVIHVAGVVNAPDRAGFAAGNIAGTQAMIDAAEAAGVARFIHVSSLAAREPQLSDYGWSKAESEAPVRAARMAWSIVRPPAIYGPGDREMLELFQMAKRGIVMLPPGGRLSVIEASDLARLLVALAEGSGAGGAVYEPDDGVRDGWDHRDFARALGDAMGRKVIPISTPAALLRLAAGADRLVRGGKAKLTPDRVRYFCHPDWVVSAAARPPADLWAPKIETRAGLAATARWYRGKGWL